MHAQPGTGHTATPSSAPCTADRLIDDDLVRFERPLLRDATLHEQLRRAGVAVGPTVLSAADIAQLESVAAETLAALGDDIGQSFLTVGRIADARLRAEITNRCGDIIRPRLEPFFVDDAEVAGSALQIKPPSAVSELNEHQDSSLTDEDRWPGVYIWIPLVDTDAHNGALHVVPGSHRLRNPQRTLNVPWQFAPFTEVLARHARRLDIPAGRAVFFDSATVHSSPPNRTDRIRLATNSFAKHAAAPMRHFYRDDDTPDGTVESYGIDVTFFLDDAIMERPRPPHRFDGLVAQHVLDVTAEDVDEACRRVAVPFAP